ncbi:acetyltransferase [Neobacillus sp. MER 74]|uniref:acetyltransferase n=1 Tax=Neobacillus sp. MER 74 TaxID=2939566 RepID=UPI00203F30F1|nr:acetyltransferase [Neobacillus sp. MER 74]MCM3115093.1 acetyltransferase [Neobacillus sp. MER 74]
MRIILIGHGGHSRVITDIIHSNQGYEIVGFLDDRYDKVKVINNTYCGPISSANRLVENIYDIKFFIAIGNNNIRQSIVNRLNLSDEYFPSLIHNSAVISPSAKIGPGTVVMPNAVLNADSRVGKHCIINTSSIIEHDSVIGDFSHISPGVNITGNVQIGDGSHVGAGSTIIPNIKIGNWSIIGAGSTVISIIPSYSTAVGIPARVKKVNGKVLEVT